VLRRSVRQLAEHLRAGGYVVGLEPSCTAVFRSDAADLLPDDLDVARLQRQTFTLAEILMDHSPGWTPPSLTGNWDQALAQVHCHQHAIMGWDADQRLLEASGVKAERLDSGCCGLAGNFGFTKGHGQVSEACAEQVMLPRIREATKQTVVLADGFSCRTQIHDLDSGGREGVHLAELLASTQRSAEPSRDEPETQLDRAHPPRSTESTAALAMASTIVAMTAWGARRLHRRLRRRRDSS
jgi:Fe-S oxidoreductase